MKITLDEADLLYVISGYLKSAGFHRSLHTLEVESGTTPYEFGRDVTFARDLCMDGRWEDLVKFLDPLKRSAFDYDRAVFLVDKQRFLELLESQTATGQR